MSTFSSVIQHRIKRIQIYINKLLKIPEIYSNPEFILFCDFKNRGASAIVTQVGKEKVLNEAIAYSKIEASGNFTLINFWKTFYMVVLFGPALRRLRRFLPGAPLVSLPAFLYTQYHFYHTLYHFYYTLYPLLLYAKSTFMILNGTGSCKTFWCPAIFSPKSATKRTPEHKNLYRETAAQTL